MGAMILVSVVLATPILISSVAALLARLFSNAVIWRLRIDIGRCRIAASSRLRFSPLEIFAQGLLQSVLAPILFCAFARIFCKRSGLTLAFAAIIRHREPVRIREPVCRAT